MSWDAYEAWRLTHEVSIERVYDFSDRDDDRPCILCEDREEGAGGRGCLTSGGR
jgi:hypothetical protein